MRYLKGKAVEEYAIQIVRRAASLALILFTWIALGSFGCMTLVCFGLNNHYRLHVLHSNEPLLLALVPATSTRTPGGRVGMRLAVHRWEVPFSEH